MNRRRLAVSVTIIVIVVVAAVLAYTLTRHSSANTATVTRGTLEATIQTTGQLAAKNPIAVRSNTAGTVQTVAVRPGDSVKTGDVLFSSIEHRLTMRFNVHRSSSPTPKRR